MMKADGVVYVIVSRSRIATCGNPDERVIYFTYTL